MVGTGLVLFINSLWLATVNVFREALAVVVRWFDKTVTTLSSQLQLIISNPISAIFVIILILISTIWFPYHPAFLGAAQSVYTCTYRPLVTQVVLPLCEALAPVVEKGEEWWNTILMIINLYKFDFITIPLRCKGTPNFINTLIESFAPLANAFVMLLQQTVNALFGISVNHNTSLVIGGLVGDVAAKISAAVSGLVSCYCSFVAYFFDALVLCFADHHFQCLIANIVSFIVEWLAQILRMIYHWIKYFLDVIVWIVNKIVAEIQNQDSMEFPKYSAWYLWIDWTNITNYVEAFGCCLGDFEDDFLNSVAYIAGKSSCTAAIVNANMTTNNTVVPPNCTMNVVENPWLCNCSIPVGQVHPFKIGGIIRAAIPPIIETFYLSYRFFQNWITFNFTLASNNFDENRLFDSYDAFCIESTNAVWSLGDGLNGLVLALTRTDNSEWFKNGTVFNAIFSGSVLTNYTCRGFVHFGRAIFKLFRDLPTYAQYRVGKYFDCMLHSFYTGAIAMADAINDFTGIIPDIYSCYRIVGNGVNCTLKMFGDNVGKMFAAFPKAAAAFVNYVITISESATSFSAVQHVPTDDIFDELGVGVRAGQNTIDALLKFTLPLHLVTFTIPKTNITMSLDEIIATDHVAEAIGDIAMLYVEVPRFLLRTFHHADFAKWQFRRADMEHLAYYEYNASMSLARLLTGALCTLSEKNTAHACFYELSLGGPPGTGICPLDLIPCPRDALARLGNAYARYLNTIYLLEPVFYINDFSTELFDRVICELESAATELNNALSGYSNIVVNLTTSWGTNTEINLGPAISGLLYGTVRIATMSNMLLTDIVRAIREKPMATNSSTCTNTLKPIYDSPSMECKSCTYYDFEGDQTCKDNFGDEYSCCSSGRCSKICRQPKQMKEEMLKSIGSMRYGFDKLGEILGVLDPQAELAAKHYGRMFAQIYRGTLRTSLAFMSKIIPNEGVTEEEVTLPGGTDILCESFDCIFADLSCVIDEYANAYGNFVALSVSLMGRLVGFVGNLVDPEHTDSMTDRLSANMMTLGRIIADLIMSLGSVIAEVIALVLRIVGATFDGHIFSDSELFCDIVTQGACGIEGAIDEIRINTRHLFANLDISGNGYACEIADLGEAIIGVVAVTVKQFVRLLDLSACGTSTDARFSFIEWFQAWRRLCAAIGNFVSGTIYSVVRIMVPSVQSSTGFKRILDGFGAIVGTGLNLIVSIIEAIVQMVLFIIQDIFGIDVESIFDDIPLELFESIRTLGSATVAFLRACAIIANEVWSVFGTIFSVTSDIIYAVIVDVESPVGELFTAMLRLFLAGINFFLSIFPGGATVSAAAREFVDAFLDLVSDLIDVIWGFIVETLDALIFPGITLGHDENGNPYGVFECISVLPVCVWNILFGTRSGGIPRQDPYEIPVFANKLLSLSNMFPPENLDCAITFNWTGNALLNLNITYCVTDGNRTHLTDPFVCIPNLNIASRNILKFRIGMCLKTLTIPTSRQQQQQQQKTKHATSKRIPLKLRENVQSGMPIYGCIDENGYLITNNSLCILQIIENVSDVTTAVAQALLYATMDSTETGKQKLFDYLHRIRMDDATIVYYQTMLNDTSSGTKSSLQKVFTRVSKYLFANNETSAEAALKTMTKTLNLLQNATVEILSALNTTDEETSSSSSLPPPSSISLRRKTTTIRDERYKRAGELLKGNNAASEKYLASRYGAQMALERSDHIKMTRMLAKNPNFIKELNDKKQQEYLCYLALRWGGDKDLSKWCQHDMSIWTSVGYHLTYNPVDIYAGPYNFTGEPEEFIPGEEECPAWCANCTEERLAKYKVSYPCPAQKCGSDYPNSDDVTTLCARICSTPARTDTFKKLCGYYATQDKWYDVTPGWLGSTCCNSAFHYYWISNARPLYEEYPGITSQFVSLFFDDNYISPRITPVSKSDWYGHYQNGTHSHYGDTVCTSIGKTGYPPKGWCAKKCGYNGAQRSFAEEMIYYQRCTYTSSCWGYLFGDNVGAYYGIWPRLMLAIWGESTPLDDRYYVLTNVMRFVYDACTDLCGPRDDYCERMPTRLECYEKADVGEAMVNQINPYTKIACMTTCDLDWSNDQETLRYVVPPTRCVNRQTMSCTPDDPEDGPRTWNTTCRCPVDRAISGECNSYECRYRYGTRGQKLKNSVPFFCPIPAHEEVDTFWPFNITTETANLKPPSYSLPTTSFLPHLTVVTSEETDLLATVYNITPQYTTGVICAPTETGAILKQVNDTLAALQAMGYTGTSLPYSFTIPSLFSEEYYVCGPDSTKVYMIPNKQWQNDSDFPFWQNVISAGTITETFILTAISEVDAYAEFVLNGVVGDSCSEEMSLLHPQLTEGYCTTVGGFCNSSATWLNPQPSSTCNRDLDCYDPNDLTIKCLCSTPQTMKVSSFAKAFNFLVNVPFDEMIPNMTIYAKRLHLLLLNPSSYNATYDLSFALHNQTYIVEFDLDIGETCQSTYEYLSNISAHLRPGLHYGYRVLYFGNESDIVCQNQSIPIDKDIVTNSSISLTDFANLFPIMDNSDINTARTIFTATVNCSHALSIELEGDFCDYLCTKSDKWCVATLNANNGTGIDCAYYRTAALTRTLKGTPGARKRFCDFFPTRTQSINSSMFPISGKGTEVLAAGAKTIFLDMPVNPTLCPTSTGRWGTQIAQQQTYGPTYSSDGCVMRGPTIPKGGNPTEKECENIQSFAEQLQQTEEWVDAGLPTNWPYFTRNVVVTADNTEQQSQIIMTEDWIRQRLPLEELINRGDDIGKEQRHYDSAKNRKQKIREKMFLNLLSGISTAREARVGRNDTVRNMRFENEETGQMNDLGSFVFRQDADWCSGVDPQRVCFIYSYVPEMCERYPDPELSPSEHLPLRECNDSTITMPCIRIKNLTIIPDIPSLLHLQSVRTVIENPLEQIIYDHGISFGKYVKQLRKKTMTKKYDSHQMTSYEISLLQSIARTLELAACSAVPGSAPCLRLDDAVATTTAVKNKGSNNVFSKSKQQHFKFERDIPAVVRSDDKGIQQYLMKADTLERRWDVVIPPLDQMRRDCYLLCGYEFRDLLRRACFWQAADSNGPIYDIVESVLDMRSLICSMIAPTNGSEWFVDGGGFLALNGSLINIPGIPFSTNVIEKNQKSAITAFISGFLLDLERAALRIAAWLLGLNLKSLSTQEFFTAIVAKIFGQSDTGQFKNNTIGWVTNFNINRDVGPVGLYYWATMFLPPPFATFGLTCDKLNGTNKLFGVIPFWNPFWTLNIIPTSIYLPTWLPNATVDLLRLTVKYDFIVPEKMIKEPSGCGRNDPMIYVPFTRPCNCSPVFYNCGEVYNISNAFDSFAFALNWLFPEVAQSRLGRFFAYFAQISDKNDIFANITGDPDFNGYLYCFIVTSPGLFWLTVASSYIFSALFVLAELLWTWVAFCFIIFVAFILYLIHRERDIELYETIKEAKQIHKRHDDLQEVFDFNRKVRDNPYIYQWLTQQKISTSSSSSLPPSAISEVGSAYYIPMSPTSSSTTPLRYRK